VELWIRSQDKRTLIQPNRIDIDYKSIIVWQNNYNCDETYLGTYETKERALEVLDEIQRLITDLQYMSYAIPNDTFTGYRPNVYGMPKE